MQGQSIEKGISKAPLDYEKVVLSSDSPYGPKVVGQSGFQARAAPGLVLITGIDESNPTGPIKQDGVQPDARRWIGCRRSSECRKERIK